ncbi:hypothetical protein AU210_012768 [Fusarium oxysporum f. sp. radicis-cucumerinum]|uniref:Azaphilone pigments biosynthesis cluster protein L N-terminal domain-containing protein n=1 Tax=Fusarium oxysporum f. sp. radicis-cucumerinum TaxID=327505 RepID=A0A2H3GFN6_FUSOX|nr:hypothetical protein AU210_012768 [Fusarium oxysporum f. sp. radicis-cucumerinum]
MAELALAIIPLGVTVTSSLVKYLKTFNDHDDDRARLVRQAERFETTFQSLRAALDRPQLNPELSISASEACLRECQNALEELDNLQQKTFATITSTVATTPHAHTKGKIKDGYKKLLYPLPKSDIEALEGALEKLSTTLSLALGILHLDEESLTRKILNEQMVEIQKSTIVNSNTSTAIKELHQPISRIDLAAPVLQTSVDAIVPHFDQRFDQISYQISYQHVQMQAQIKSLLDMAGPARYQDHLGTNQQPSYNHSGEQGNYIAARETEQELRTLYKRADSVSTCSCHLQRVRQSKSLAVIRNNLQEVERLLSLHAHMLKEVSFYGETPLHIAIYRLDILKTLVKKANPEIWIQRSNYGATVLSLAIQVSHEICDRGNALDESCCPCTLPLRIILAAGCPIIPHRDFLQDGHRDIPEWSFSEASLHCKILLAKELRSRRRQLRDLVRNKLSITELSNFTTLEEVPDVDAIEMDRLLRQKGIFGLGPLSTFADKDLSRRPWRELGYYSRSIFFDLKTPEDADLFVDSGFKMICTDQDHDSSLDRALLDRISPWMHFISLDYAIWLFDHQAPLWKWSYRFTSPMPSVFVLADILGMQDYKCPGQDKTSNRAEHFLSESDLVDKCSCLCSPDGCTPFTSRMKWLAHPREQAEDFALQDYATRFGSHVEIYGRSLNLGHHVIMVRQATFAALELKHTCLDRPGYSHWPTDPNWMYWLDPVTELEPDELEFEILNIDVEAMNQLEEVVVMFQDFVLTGRQTTISSKSDSFDIDYSAFNEPSALGIDDLCYQRILEFWQHIWTSRMQVALDTVAERWDDKLDGQNDLVQISTCEEAIQETGNSLEEEDEEEIFNRIIQRIQDI